MTYSGEQQYDRSSIVKYYSKNFQITWARSTAYQPAVAPTDSASSSRSSFCSIVAQDCKKKEFKQSRAMIYAKQFYSPNHINSLMAKCVAWHIICM